MKETARQAKTEKRKAVEFERIEKAKKKHESEVNELFDKTASFGTQKHWSVLPSSP